MKKSFYLRVALVGLLIITMAVLVYPQISDRASANEEIETNDINTFVGTDFDDPFGDNSTGEEILSEEEKTEDSNDSVDDGNQINEPIDPIGPTDPIEPIDPIRPIDPINPIEPTDPIDPEIPEDEELDEGSLIIGNPFDGGEVELVSNEIDRDAFVAKAIEEHDRLYKSSLIINPLKELMFKQITDKIFDEKLYSFETPEDFYVYTMTRRNACIVEIEKQYMEMLGKEHSTDTTTVSYGSALPKVSSDITNENYTSYASSGASNSSSNSALAPGYINSAVQDVRPIKTTVLGEEVDKYREYELTWGIDLSGVPSASQAGNAEIWILIDNSKSMSNNFPSAIAGARKLIDTLMPSNYKAEDPEAIKIGIISFANSSRVVVSPTSNRNSLLSGLNGIRLNLGADTGTGGTNLQDAIVLLKNQMNITDDSTPVSSNIKKMAIVMSDGQVTTRYTDRWTETRSPFVSASATIQSGNKPVYGTKRWSYLITSGWDNGRTVIEQVALPSGSTHIANTIESGTDSNYAKQVAFNREVSILEGQLLASQGVELYTVGYSDDSENVKLLQDLTQKLSVTPSFISTELTNKPLSDGVSTSSGDGGYYGYNSVNSLIDNIQSKVKVEKKNYFTNYFVTGKVIPNFRFENTSLVVSKKPFGEEPINWGTLNKSYSQFTLTTPKDFEPGTYYVTGKIISINSAFLPKGAGKELYGPEASDKINLAEKMEIAFTETDGVNKNLTVEGTKVNVIPKLSIAIEAETDLLLVGEDGEFNPMIKTGSGYYKYTLEETANKEPKKVISEKADLKATPSYDVNLGKIEKDFETDGNYKFTLTVEDLVSGEKKIESRDVYIREGILNVNIVNETNKDKTAPFETQIKSTLDGVQQAFYLVGTGNRKFTYKTGSKSVVRGAEFEAKTFVPFGYELVSVSDTDGTRSDGKVKIDLVKNGFAVSGNEQTITIKVREKTNPRFFFDWSWAINNVSGSIVRKDRP